MFSSSQCLYCWIQLVNTQYAFFLTFVYASNDSIDRRELWSKLEDLHPSIGNSPWLLVGDFNVIKHPSEKLGGRILNTYEQDFLACSETIGVVDHLAVGCYYTWTNKREDGTFLLKN